MTETVKRQIVLSNSDIPSAFKTLDNNTGIKLYFDEIKSTACKLYNEDGNVLYFEINADSYLHIGRILNEYAEMGYEYIYFYHTFYDRKIYNGVGCVRVDIHVLLSYLSRVRNSQKLIVKYWPDELRIDGSIIGHLENISRIDLINMSEKMNKKTDKETDKVVIQVSKNQLYFEERVPHLDTLDKHEVSCKYHTYNGHIHVITINKKDPAILYLKGLKKHQNSGIINLYVHLYETKEMYPKTVYIDEIDDSDEYAFIIDTSKEVGYKYW